MHCFYTADLFCSNILQYWSYWFENAENYSIMTCLFIPPSYINSQFILALSVKISDLHLILFFFFGLMVVCEIYFYQDHIHLPTLFLYSLYGLFLGNQISKDWITRMGEKKSFHAWTEATQIFRSWVGEGTAFGAFNQVCRCNDASYPFIWPTLQNNCFLISPW